MDNVNDKAIFSTRQSVGKGASTHVKSRHPHVIQSQCCGGGTLRFAGQPALPNL